MATAWGWISKVTACVVLAVSLPAPAAPRPLEVAPIAANALPKGATIRGDTTESIVTFRDKNGANYLVMSSKDTSVEDRDAPEPIRARYLYVDDWIVSKSGQPRSLLPVRDMVTNCVMGDLSAKFHDAAFGVTDLDHDGFAEITFAYELTCRSDVRPATYKLLLIENGTKYILRGETRIESGGGMGPPGGAFQADPPAAKWPPAFLARATKLWEDTVEDLEIPPRTGDPN